MKVLGPKFGPQLRDVVAAIAAAPPAELSLKAQGNGPFTVGEFELEPGDLLVTTKAREGWAGAVNGNTQVLLDIRLTKALREEGFAREVIRHVQEARKEAGLEIEDRIVLALETDAPDLRQAIETHRDYLAAETLTVCWGSVPLDGAAYTKTVEIEKQRLTIQLKRKSEASQRS
jgi:isoleucyl-tRNA synthetase